MCVTSPAQVHAVTTRYDRLPKLRLPLGRLAGCVLGAAGAVLIAGTGLALTSGGAPDARLQAEFWSGAVLIAGTLAGLAFLRSFGPRPAFGWAPLVITAGFIRMAVSLTAAMAAWSAYHPDKLFFWATFLIGSAVILATETAVVRAALSCAPTHEAVGGLKSEIKAA
jgi:hypothetical protein